MCLFQQALRFDAPFIQTDNFKGTSSADSNQIGRDTLVGGVSYLVAENVGFKEIDRQEMDGTLVIEVVVEDSQTSFVLYDRAFVESHSPGTATSAPSLMFYSKDIFGLYKKMQTQSVTLGDMVQLGEEYVFNFADPDGNYFAVTGK